MDTLDSEQQQQELQKKYNKRTLNTTMNQIVSQDTIRKQKILDRLRKKTMMNVCGLVEKIPEDNISPFE